MVSIWSRPTRDFATGELALLKPLAPAFRRVLDKVDAGLLQGGIDAILPDGSRRRLGFRTDGPVASVRLNSWLAMLRLATSGSVGWYKAWEQSEWDSPDPVPLFDLFMRNGRSLGEVGRAKGLWRLANRAAHAVRRNTPLRARQNIEAHYDLGNDFYAAWLDQTMTYSSAVFADGDSLEEAQGRKLKLLLDRLDLKPGQRLLEIGCGWGSLAEIAARDYGVRVVGLTLSTEQKAYADQRMAKANLAGMVEIRLADYRELDERFDAVASVEMVEAVGQEYWDEYLAAIGRSLSPGGRAALQLISIDPALFDGYAAQRRLHPDLHLPRRNADQRAALRRHRRRSAPQLGRPGRLRPALCRDPAHLAAALRHCGSARRAKRLRRRVPAPVALLFDVLRGRLPGRRHRCRPGDDGQELGLDPHLLTGLRIAENSLQRSPWRRPPAA